MHTATVADLPPAVRPDLLEEPTEKLPRVEARGAWTCPARLAGGEGHGAVRERDETAMGARHCADIRGEGGQGGAGRWRGLAVDVPGDRPALWVDGLQPSGFGHLLFPHGSGEGREGFHRDQEVGAGGEPRVTVCGATATWDDVMERRVVWEGPAPGRQATGKTRQSRPADTRVVGEPFESVRRGGAQGVGREAVLGAETGTQGLRDGAGEEDVRPGTLLLQVVGYALLGGMRRTRRPGSVAPGMLDAVVRPPAVALRDAVSRGAAGAGVDGAADRAVRGGEGGRTLQGRWGTGGEDRAEGGHGRRPCLRALRRS